MYSYSSVHSSPHFITFRTGPASIGSAALSSLLKSSDGQHLHFFGEIEKIAEFDEETYAELCELAKPVEVGEFIHGPNILLCHNTEYNDHEKEGLMEVYHVRMHVSYPPSADYHRICHLRSQENNILLIQKPSLDFEWFEDREIIGAWHDVKLEM